MQGEFFEIRLRLYSQKEAGAEGTATLGTLKLH